MTTMQVKNVGTLPVILLKLATPPLPPQTKFQVLLSSIVGMTKDD